MTNNDISTIIKYLTDEEIDELKRAYPNINIASHELDEQRKQHIRKLKLQYYYEHKAEIAAQRRMRRQLLKTQK